MSQALTWTLVTLATTRITRVLTDDDIGAPWRRWLISLGQRRDKAIAAEAHNRAIQDAAKRIDRKYVEPDPTPPLWALRMETLAMCSWCSGFWVALFGATPYLIFATDVVVTPWSLWLGVPFAMSWAIGLGNMIADWLK